MAYSHSNYDGDGLTTQFNFGFEYLEKAHVRVMVNGEVTTDWEWVSPSTIRFFTAPAAGAVIVIGRFTSRAQRLVDYAVPSSLNEQDLDADSLQAFYMAQEAIDTADSAMIADVATGQFNAQDRQIKNIANPSDPQDAVTKAWAETAMSSQLALAIQARETTYSLRDTTSGLALQAGASQKAAAASEGNARTSETNAKTSETNAKASETAAASSVERAATSEANAKVSETNAKTSETNAKTSETNAKASETKAKTSETNAKISETNAAASAAKAQANVDALDPTSYVRTSAQTLTDDQKGQARSNIGLGQVQTFAGGIRIRSPNNLRDIRVSDDGGWGSYNDDGSGWRALGVGQGGTGAKDAGGARNNLGLNRVEQDSYETRIKTSDGNRYLYMRGDGGWGVINMGALAVHHGGTGSTDANGARHTLEVPSWPANGRWTSIEAYGDWYVPAGGTWVFFAMHCNPDSGGGVYHHVSGVVAGGHRVPRNGNGYTRGWAWKIAG